MFKRLFNRNPEETTAPESPSEAAEDKKPPQSEAAVESVPERIAPQTAAPQPPSPNHLLAQAMQSVAESDNPQTRAALYQAFLQGHFWMPIAAPPDNPTGQDVQVQVPGLQDPEGNKLLAVFTDAEALAAFIPNSPYLAVPTMDFFRMAVGTDIQYVAVNPWPPEGQPTRPGGRLMRFEFEALARGEMPQLPQQAPQAQSGEIPQGQQVQISRAETSLPLSAIEELKKAAQYEPIRTIFYLQMQMPPNPPVQALAFELTHTPPQTVIRDMFEALANRLRPHLEQQVEALQFITVDGPGVEQCRQAGETLYVRER